MKKFYAFAAVAAMAFAVNAQNGAPLYIVGAGEGLNWDVPTETTTQVPYVDGVYTMEVANLSQFKISPNCEGWAGFNAAAVGCEYGEEQGVAVALAPTDANIQCPWVGDYTITVAGDLSTITLSTNTPKPEGPTKLYFRGDLEGTAGWSAEPAWEWTFLGDDVYKFVCADGQCIPAATAFKVADANWNTLNFGFENEGDMIIFDAPTPLINDGGSKNMTLEEEWNGCAYMDVKNGLLFMSLEKDAENPFEGEGAVSTINAENGVAKYYNLQGVRVSGNEKGLVIIVKDGKATKVVK